VTNTNTSQFFVTKMHVLVTISASQLGVAYWVIWCVWLPGRVRTQARVAGAGGWGVEVCVCQGASGHCGAVIIVRGKRWKAME
jgi:hypothetical protein